MRIKRLAALFSAALAAGALSLPSGASGLAVKMEGKAVADETAQFSGQVEFNILGSGIKCPWNMSVTFDGEEVEVPVSGLTIKESECVFFGSTFQGCQFESAPVATFNEIEIVEHVWIKLPWVVDIEKALFYS